MDIHIFSAILTISFSHSVLFPVAVAYNHVTEKVFVSNNDIIKVVKVNTVTSCIMQCQQIVGCLFVGFYTENLATRPLDCVLVRWRSSNSSDLGTNLFVLRDAPVQYWQHISLINSTEVAPSRGNVLMTIPKFTKEYKLSCQIKQTELSPLVTTSLLQLTNDKADTYGYDILSIMTGRVSDWDAARIRVLSAVRTPSTMSSPKHVWKIKDADLSEWNTLRVTQLQEASGEYRYEITFNGKVQYSVINVDARSFENVLVYFGRPDKFPFKGFVRSADLYLGFN